MAGHVRTTPTGKARRAGKGRPRQVREHLPPGEAEAAKRRKQHLGARAVAVDRIGRTSDPLRRLDIAREYVRSAAAKYQPDAAVIEAAVTALLSAGDTVFATGVPLTAAMRRARRDTSTRHRARREQVAVLVREGAASVRQRRGHDGRSLAS